MLSLSFNISETKHDIKNLTKDITVTTSKVLFDKPKVHCHFPLKAIFH